MNSDTSPNEMSASHAGAPEPTPNDTAPPTSVVGYCRICGRALQPGEDHRVQDVIYCEAHLPTTATREQTPLPPPNSEWTTGVVGDGSVSPGLAFLLGLIPGVGAIYNGQYAKGLIHVVVFGLIISLLSSGGTPGLFVPLLIGWIFYMPFEAFHTAKKRQMGEPVDEFSSLISMKSGVGSKAGPIVLIAAGVFFLLINLGIIELYQIWLYWPVLLIALGVWMLYSRQVGRSAGEE